MTIQGSQAKFKALGIAFIVALTICLFFLLPAYVRVKLHQSIFGGKRSDCVLPTIKMGRASAEFLLENVTKPTSDFTFPPLAAYKKDVIYKVRYPYMHTDSFRCSYTPIYRKNPRACDRNYVESYDTAKTPVAFKDRIRAPEFVKVNCNYGNYGVYEEYFALHPPKKPKLFKKQGGTLNVLVLGIKSVSRYNIHRAMPQTVQYLINELNATEFHTYNRVGKSTFDNLWPLLTGLNSYQFNHKCSVLKEVNAHCPFIWDLYANRGYKTSFAEDCVENSFFKEKYVFRVRPTHYYWAPLNVAAQENTGHVDNGKCKLYLRNKPSYKVLLDYALNFASSMNQSQQPYFGFFWVNSLTSTPEAVDGLNLIAMADEDYRMFFQSLKSSGLLTETIVVFLSDSGYMTRSLQHLKPYRVQENLPFLFIALPENFKKMYPVFAETLNANSENLVTLFDVHQTLKELIHCNYLSTGNSRSLSEFSGLNLFRDMPSRRCKLAGISSPYCSCKSVPFLSWF